MSLFDQLKNQSVNDRVAEEKRYDQVASELRNGVKKDGLWLKSLENSRGNEEKAKSIYIKYRIQSLKDEEIIAYENNIVSQSRNIMETKSRINHCVSLLKYNGYTVHETSNGWLVKDRLDGKTLIPRETSIGSIEKLEEFTKLNCKKT